VAEVPANEFMDHHHPTLVLDAFGNSNLYWYHNLGHRAIPSDLCIQEAFSKGPTRQQLQVTCPHELTEWIEATQRGDLDAALTACGTMCECYAGGVQAPGAGICKQVWCQDTMTNVIVG
jgi:hypothetical protein